MNETFAERFEYYLRRSGYSQADLAIKLNVVRSTITQWKKSRNPIPADAFARICELFELNESEKDELHVLARKLDALSGDYLPVKVQGEAAIAASPCQIPKGTSQHFVGRGDEINMIMDNLYPGREVTLIGPGGMGKTELAIMAVRQLRADGELATRFPDGVIFYSFYGEGKENIETLYDHILVSFEKETRQSLKHAILDLLAERQVLLILDGTECFDNFGNLLDVIGSKCGLLITTQRETDMRGTPIRVAPLSLEQATIILRTYVGENTDDVEMVKRMYSLVGGLTLAFCLVGRYLKSTNGEENIAAYVNWLEEQPLEALEVGPGKHRRDSVFILLKRSVSYLSPEAQFILTLFGILAFHNVGHDVLKAAFPDAGSKIRRSLAQLIDYGLLIRRSNQYRVRHALIYTYVKKHMRAPDEAVYDLVKFYVQFVEQQKRLRHEADPRLFDERLHIVALVKSCAAHKQWEAVLYLTDVINGFSELLSLSGFWPDYVSTMNAGMAAAREMQDRGKERIHLDNLAGYYFLEKQYPLAIEYHKLALAISRETGDRQSEVKDLKELAGCFRWMRQYQQAIEHYEQVLTIVEKIGNSFGTEICLGELASTYAFSGQYQQAAHYYMQALNSARENRNRNHEPEYLAKLGSVFASLGQHQQAIDNYLQALIIHCESRDRNSESNCLTSLGSIFTSLGKHQQAADYYMQALIINREVGNRYGEADCLDDLGSAYAWLGQYQVAIEYFEQALAIERKMDFHPGEQGTLDHLGNVYSVSGQYLLAIEHHKLAIGISQAIGDRRREAVYLDHLASDYIRSCQHQQAVDYYMQALIIHREVIDRQAELDCLIGLGNAYFRLSQYQEAIEYHEQGLSIAREVGNRRREGVLLGSLMYSYAKLERISNAISLGQLLLTIQRETGDKPEEGKTLRNLGHICYSAGSYQQSFQFYQEAILILRQTGSRQQLGRSLIYLGKVLLTLGKIQDAEPCCREAVIIAQEVDDKHGEALALENLGITQKEHNHIAEARQSWQRSLQIFMDLTLPDANRLRDLLDTL